MDYSKDNNVKRRNQSKSNVGKSANKAGVLIFRALVAVVLIGGFAAVGAGVGAYFGILQNAPKIDAPKILPNIYTSYIVDKDMNELDRLKGEENRKYVHFKDIPQSLKDAFVAIEDERFYQHNGVDLRGVARAVFVTLTDPDRVEGASTITQQIIKNNVRKISRNTLETKLQEQYLAIQYEKDLVASYEGDVKAAKDYILEVYMNTIALGHNLNGVQTAANYYFDKEVADLTLSESAVIAAITQYPTKYAPDVHPDDNKYRRGLILDKMLELGLINQKEHDDALKDNPYARISQSEAVLAGESTHSYFNDQIITVVARDLQDAMNIGEREAYNYLYNGGLTIVSTQDMEMQAIMDESFVNDEFFPQSGYEIDVQYYLSVKNKVTEKVTHFPMKRGTVYSMDEVQDFAESKKLELMSTNDEIIGERIIPVPQPQAAMVVIDYHNGHVKALLGGRGEKLVNLALNRATNSERQPGSVFKVLASYAPALDMGRITAATVIDDVPFDANDPSGHQFRNWYSNPRYRGLSTVREGIANSMNVITVKNMYETGIEACYNYLLNFGFTTLVDREERNGKVFSDKTLSTALGGITDGVTQLETAAAYGAIANGGMYVEPIFYTKVLDHDGKTILENTPEPRQVLKKPVAYILTSMLQDVLTYGTGNKARFSEVKMPVAGKTGTTSATKDLTFVGYTPYYVGSIWLGYDQPKEMTENKGYHMQLWSDVMEKIHAELPHKEFDRPDGLVTATICKESGKLSVSGLCDQDSRGKMARSEYFVAGTQPTESCDVHVSVTLDTVTGMRASALCPVEDIATEVRIIRPIPYEGDEFIEDQPYEVKREALEGVECTVHSGGMSLPEYYIDPVTGEQIPLMPDTTDTEEQGDALVIPTIPPQTGTTQPVATNTPVLPVTPTTPPATPKPTPVPTPTPTPTATPTAVPEYSPTPSFATPVPTPQATGDYNGLPVMPTVDDPTTQDEYSH